LKILGSFAVNGQQYVMDVVERLTEATDALPESRTFAAPVAVLMLNKAKGRQTSQRRMDWMLPDTEIYPHLATLGKNAASGVKHILEVAEHLKTITDTLPDDLKPVGQALADITMQALIESYAEWLRLFRELRF
jgi:hypothetical protein